MALGEATGEDRRAGRREGDCQPAARRNQSQGARRPHQHHPGPDLTLFELDEAANRIRSEVDPDANIMVGSTLDPEMAGMMRVSVVATGIDAAVRSEAMPTPRRAGTVAAPAPAAAVTAPVAAPAPRPAVASQPAAFADHQAEAEELAFDEPESRGVPQPAAVARTAPFGQPKIEGAAEGQPRRPGEPSPEALRRLQAAVQNVPKTPPMIQTAQPAVREAERHSRLTINSLIHRMTGQVGRDETPARPRATDPGVARTQNANASTFRPS